MIHIFGKLNNLNIVFEENTLNEEQKSQAILIVEKLPELEIREGYSYRLCYDGLKLYWEYDEIINEEIIEEQL